MPGSTTKKQFQQTNSKFGTAIKASHGVQAQQAVGAGTKKNLTGANGQLRKKSKTNLNPTGSVQTVPANTSSNPKNVS